MNPTFDDYYNLIIEFCAMDNIAAPGESDLYNLLYRFSPGLADAVYHGVKYDMRNIHNGKVPTNYVGDNHMKPVTIQGRWLGIANLMWGQWL